VLDVLKSEGYIRGYSRARWTTASRVRDRAEVLRRRAGDPRDRARVAPGRRVYASVKNDPAVANGLGVSILSTPKGVMADHEAREQNVGGEVLCRSSEAEQPITPKEGRRMSRIGKKPVAGSGQGVTATVNGQTVTAKGPKGELSCQRRRDGQVNDKQTARSSRSSRRNDSQAGARAWGHVAHADRQHR
jgi:small subunit ribosomal protein S8